MIAFLLAVLELFRTLWRGLKDPEFRALLFLVVLLVVAGTVFYSRIEGWSLLDSAFFSLITLTTVGYGDMVPTTPISKIFTMIYLVAGISVLLGFLNKVGGMVVKRHHERYPHASGKGGEAT